MQLITVQKYEFVLEFKLFKLKFLDLIGKIRGFTMPISCGCSL